MYLLATGACLRRVRVGAPYRSLLVWFERECAGPGRLRFGADFAKKFDIAAKLAEDVMTESDAINERAMYAIVVVAVIYIKFSHQSHIPLVRKRYRHRQDEPPLYQFFIKAAASRWELYKWH